MSLSTKLLAVVAGGAVIAGGTMGAIHLSNRGTPISELLKSETTKVIIEDSDDNDWRNAWRLYYANATKNKWALEGELQGAEIHKDFKSTCQIKIKDKVRGKESQEYKDFIAWCTKNKAGT